MREPHVLDSRDDKDFIQNNIRRMVMRVLSLLQVCLDEEYRVSVHDYLQEIIIMKIEKKIQG